MKQFLTYLAGMLSAVILVEWHEEFPVLDEEEEEDNYEPDDSMLECGYDPYMGCYSDDC